jgi:hypothetical protein
MMIFKKAIPRRTFLRGVGAALALPLLDGMVPAFASAVEGASKPGVRLGFVYVPNGIIMDKWTPSEVGKTFDLTPILEPLVPFKDRLVVLSGLNSSNVHSSIVGANHARAAGALLTGLQATKKGLSPNGKEDAPGISMDQIAARELGKHTQLASLELAVDSTDLVGNDDEGYRLVYTHTISWRGHTAPIPMENNPRAVFERLFGDSDSTDPAERLARIRENRSILDVMRQDVVRLETGLGQGDRAKLTEWLDAVRDVERRIHVAEEQPLQELPALDQLVGIPATFEEHAKLMLDLQVLAYQCDLTRVTTFMMAREQSGRAYPEIGVADPHHPLSHHQRNARKIEQVIKINTYHAKMFSYYLDKLRSTPDGDGSLLDHVLIMYASGISDGNLHLYDNLPVLLVGGGQGQVSGGVHLRYPKDTPITNLYLTVLDKVGVPVENLGDSTGKLELLSV